MNGRYELEGCTNLFEFGVENRPLQKIFLVGEHHHLPGNSIPFLQDLSREVECPIDVIVEQPYESFYGFLESNQMSSPISNMNFFRKKPWSICLQPTHVQTKNNLYFKTCIQPFQGKLKVWGADIRFTSLFKLFLNISDDLVEKMKFKDLNTIKITLEKNKMFETFLYHPFKNTIKSFLQFELYALSSEYYKKNIFDNLEILFENMGTFFKKEVTLTRTNLEKLTKKILTSRDKSHLSLAESITTNFPPAVYKKWTSLLLENIEKDPQYCLSLGPFMDLETVLRIYKILRLQSQGIILVYAGSRHTNSIKDLLSIQSAKKKSVFNASSKTPLDPKLILIRKNSTIRSPNKVKIEIPTGLKCDDKTQNMKMYDRYTKKKRKNRSPSILEPKTKKLKMVLQQSTF